MKTAVQAFQRILGVILTGSGSDGAKGAVEVKRAGGRILVQNEESCASFDMPRAAIHSRAVDFVLPLDRIASAIYSLVAVPGADEFFRVSPDFDHMDMVQSRGFKFALPYLDS
jgi:two-component system chemotaxis response regulator CheB